MTSRSYQNAHEFANIILKCFSSTKSSYIWNAFWLKDISTCIVAEHCEVVYLTLIRYFNPCFTKIRTLGAVPIYRRHLPSIVIPLIKVRLSHDRLIFIMEIPCLKRPSLCWVGALVVRCETITGTNFSNVTQWIWRNQIFFLQIISAMRNKPGFYMQFRRSPVAIHFLLQDQFLLTFCLFYVNNFK